MSDHDTHADHDARAGLRAEHEYDQRELADAEPKYVRDSVGQYGAAPANKNKFV